MSGKIHRGHTRSRSIVPPVPSRSPALAVMLKSKQSGTDKGVGIHSFGDTASVGKVAKTPRNAAVLPKTSTPSLPDKRESEKKTKVKLSTRGDAVADFFIVVGIKKEQQNSAQMKPTMVEHSSATTTSESSPEPVGQSTQGFSLDLLIPMGGPFSPVVLDRYPPTDYSNATVDPMIPDFCMPLGVTVREGPSTSNSSEVTSTTGTRSHQFTLTVGDGSKVYGSALRFDEVLSVGSLGWPHPTLSQTLSKKTYREMFLRFLESKANLLEKDGVSSADQEYLGEVNHAISSLNMWEMLDEYRQSASQERQAHALRLAKYVHMSLERIDRRASRPSSLSWMLKTQFWHQAQAIIEKQAIDSTPNEQAQYEDFSTIETLESDDNSSSDGKSRSSTISSVALADYNSSSMEASVQMHSDEYEKFDESALTGVCVVLEKDLLPLYRKYLSSVDATHIHVPKCIVMTGRYPFFKVFDYWLQSFLLIAKNNKSMLSKRLGDFQTDGSTGSNSSIARLAFPLSLEHLIAFCLEEVPLPPRGKVRLKMSLCPNDRWVCAIPPINIERPPLNRLPLCNFSFLPLLTALSAEQLVAVVTALLLDQKVIILSDDISKIPCVCDALALLLFPFRWQNPYVPLLPRSMCDIIYAPMGFLIGLPAYLYDPDDPMIDGECVIVDLDEKCVIMAENMPKCQMPRRPRSALLKGLHSLLDQHEQLISEAINGGSMTHVDQDMHAANYNDSYLNSYVNDDALCKDLRGIFVKCFAHILDGYKKYLSSSESFEELFDKKRFVKNYVKHHRDRGENEGEVREFFETFLETQMFQMFIEDRVWPSDRNFEVLLFDAYIEQRSHSHHVHTTSNFLDDTSQEVDNEINLVPALVPINSNIDPNYECHDILFQNLDHSLMDQAAKEALNKVDSEQSFALQKSEKGAQSMLLRRSSASSAVMEGVYLAFYTGKKKFSTKHRFAMAAAKDALYQSGLLMKFLQIMQNIDSKFVQACSSVKKNHEAGFRWQQDNSQLMREVVWKNCLLLHVDMWVSITGKYCQQVDAKVCVKIREACRLLQNRAKLLEEEENAIIEEMDCLKREVEIAKKKRDNAEDSYVSLMSRAGLMQSSQNPNGTDEVLDASRAHKKSVVSSKRKPLTHSENEKLLRIKRKREETRLTYSQKIARLTHVLKKYNHVMTTIMKSWDTHLRKHHNEIVVALQSLCQIKDATLNEMKNVLLRMREILVPTEVETKWKKRKQNAEHEVASESSTKESIEINSSVAAMEGVMAEMKIKQNFTIHEEMINSYSEENFVPLGAILKFMAHSMGMEEHNFKVNTAFLENSDLKVTSINKDRKIFAPKLKRGFNSMQEMIVQEFGHDAFQNHTQKLTDAFELMYTSEADGVIERGDGFNVWYDSTRKAKNIARSALGFFESMNIVFEHWKNELEMLCQDTDYVDIRLHGDGSIIAKADSFKVQSSQRVKTRRLTDALVRPKPKIKKVKRRMFANSTLGKAIGKVLEDAHLRVDAISSISFAIRKHSLECLAKQRRHLKETFHALQEKERDSVRFLANANSRCVKAERDLYEAEQVSMTIAEQLRSAQELHRIGIMPAIGSDQETGKAVLAHYSVLSNMDIVWMKKTTAFGPSFAAVKSIFIGKSPRHDVEIPIPNIDGFVPEEQPSGASKMETSLLKNSLNDITEVEIPSSPRASLIDLGRLSADDLKDVRHSPERRSVSNDSRAYSSNHIDGESKTHSISASMIATKESHAENSMPNSHKNRSHELLPKRADLKREFQTLSSGMILTHIDGQNVPDSYEEALQAIHAAKPTSLFLFAPPSHISSLNVAEKLAKKLTDASLVINDAATALREAKRECNEAAIMNETTIESIFRQFRRVESSRVNGMRQSMLQVIDACIQQYTDSCLSGNTSTSTAVKSINAGVDFQMYDEFNTRVNAYHARDGVMNIDTKFTSHRRTISNAISATPKHAKKLSPRSTKARKARHHRRNTSTVAPPVPPRPSTLEMSSLNSIASTTSIITESSSSQLDMQLSPSASIFSHHLQKNLPKPTTDYTFVDHVKAESFNSVQRYIASGREWYRSLQHYLQTRNEVQEKLASQIENSIIECLDIQAIKDLGSIEKISTISSRQTTKEINNPGLESSAQVLQLKAMHLSSSTRSHMQIWHCLRNCFIGWQKALMSSSSQLGTFAVRVRHLKRELKGTLGMIRFRSQELNAQLRQAQKAPIRAAKRCHELESRLAELEQRYSNIRKRRNISQTFSSAGALSLENTVLNFRNKTEAARQKLIHAQTESRVMQTKYDQCLLQLLELTEQTFLQFFREMKAVMQYFVQLQINLLDEIDSSGEILTGMFSEFNYEERTQQFNEEMCLPTAENVDRREGLKLKFLHKHLSIGICEAKEASEVYAQLAQFCLCLHKELKSAYEGFNAITSLEEALSHNNSNDMGASKHGESSINAKSTTKELGNSQHELFDKEGSRFKVQSEKTIKYRSGRARRRQSLKLAATASHDSVKSSNMSLSTTSDTQIANNDITYENRISFSIIPNSIMARTLSVILQYKQKFCAGFGESMWSTYLRLGRTFNQLAENTRKTVEKLEEKQNTICSECDRIAQNKEKAKIAFVKAEIAFKNACGSRLQHDSPSDWQIDLNNEDDKAKGALYIASALKRSSSGVRNRLKNHTGWVRRNICVDKNYVGWFTPWNSDSASTPTGGVQSILIEDIEIESGQHALGCPSKYVVVLRRLPKVSAGTHWSKKGRGKSWYFGFENHEEAERLVQTIRDKTNMQYNATRDDCGSSGEDNSDSLMGTILQESLNARKLRQKRDEAMSCYLFMDHLEKSFGQNEYTPSTHWAALTLKDMQAQRQFFSHSLLKLLADNRSSVLETLRGNVNDVQMFADSVNPLQLLQDFIQTILQEQGRQNTVHD